MMWFISILKTCIILQFITHKGLITANKAPPLQVENVQEGVPESTSPDDQEQIRAKLQAHVEREMMKILSTGGALPAEFYHPDTSAELIVPIDGMISDESELIIRIPPSGNDETIAHADAFQIDPDKDNGSKNLNANDNAGALPPIINHDEVLKSTKWTSYPAKGCSQSEQNKILTMLKGKIPVSFSRYDCLRLFLELKHHQKTSMWTERAVLEELLFSLLSLSEEQLLDTANWESHPLVNHGKWLSDLHHCQWGGVTCGITTIGVAEGNQENTFDNTRETVEECKKSRLKARHRNRCDGRSLYDGWICGPCPQPDIVTKLDLTKLGLTGVLTENLYMLTRLSRINVMGNSIHGGFPDTYEQFKYLEFVDISRNQMSGSFPEHLPMSIAELWLEENHFVGTIPKSIATRKELSYVDLSRNLLKGTIPRDIGKMTWLNSLYISRNELSGTIPDWEPTIYLRLLDLSHNSLSGTLPLSLAQSLYALEHLDVSGNRLTGIIPDFTHNNNNNNMINLTANRFVGEIPPALCRKGPYASIFGCDAFICPGGTYSPSGAASQFGKCVQCEGGTTFLGQTSCATGEYVVGDLDFDGTLSQREVLHLLFTFTNGFGWGDQYTKFWSDIQTPSCDLPGITCQDEFVTEINITASMCAGYNKYSDVGCAGLPSELGLLPKLKLLFMRGGDQKLQGSIPKEIAYLKHLEYIDLEGSAIQGSINELANLKSLRVLNLQRCSISGTLPSFNSTSSLRVLNLAQNELEGSIPSSYGDIMGLEELILSRNRLAGTIIDFKSQKLDNLELYGNSLRGTIPESLGSCSALKRIDLFANSLTGTIPYDLRALSNLQILHLKSNNLSGPLPSNLIDDMANFIWLDVSENQISGKIPESYGKSSSLKDLRLGQNEIFGPIPTNLCLNKDINDAPSPEDMYGCDHILCPLETISQAGYATTTSKCVPCPEGQSTLFLGSDKCREFSDKEILMMLYAYLGSGNDEWNEEFRKNDPASDICEWHGVTCEDGVIKGLSFPNSGMNL